jgi:hypothetical protein
VQLVAAEQERRGRRVAHQAQLRSQIVERQPGSNGMSETERALNAKTIAAAAAKLGLPV